VVNSARPQLALQRRQQHAALAHLSDPMQWRGGALIAWSSSDPACSGDAMQGSWSVAAAVRAGHNAWAECPGSAVAAAAPMQPH